MLPLYKKILCPAVVSGLAIFLFQKCRRGRPEAHLPAAGRWRGAGTCFGMIGIEEGYFPRTDPAGNGRIVARRRPSAHLYLC